MLSIPFSMAFPELTLDEKIKLIKQANIIRKAVASYDNELIPGKPTQEKIDGLLALAEALGLPQEEITFAIEEYKKQYDNNEAEKTNTLN